MFVRGLAGFAFAVACFGAVDPASVVVLVNDQTPPEAGTGATGASVWVGEYYATRRGIPFANIIHLNIPSACCNPDPHEWDNWNISWDKFDTYIRVPLKASLESRGLQSRVKYIVPTYGVPVRAVSASYPSGLQPDYLSIDSFLAALYSGSDAPYGRNPYAVSVPTYSRTHFSDWVNPLGWPMYLVCRLDGPSALIAAGLVDKAISAESTLTRNDGIGYFDYQNNGNDPVTDATMSNAYNFAVQQGFRGVLNDQSVSHQMIHSAPQTLWAWGWYSGPTDWDGYEFVNGAVGAQLTSYTANIIRYQGAGTWVPRWLTAGITATWGATGEPYTSGYANGDNLLQHFWMGYNFGESAYLSAPVLNWMMVFVGDPLYAPHIFDAPVGVAPRTPTLSFNAHKDGLTYSGPLTLFASVPPGTTSVQFQANGYPVGKELTRAPYAASFAISSEDNGPYLLTAKTTDASGQSAVSDPVPVVLYVSPSSDVSVAPSSGSGSSQRFTFTFSGLNNADSLNMLINSSITAGSACYLIYLPSQDRLTLVDDGGSNLAGLANSQCSVDPSSVAVTNSGGTVTIAANLTFNSTFAGAKTVWATWYGSGAQQTEWRNVGSWTVPGIVATPSSGSGMSGQFTFTFAGVSNAASLNVLIHSSLTAANGCYMIYLPSRNELDLVDDGGSNLLSSLTNSQCTVSAVSVKASSDVVTISGSITFAPSFGGSKSILATWYRDGAQQTDWLNLGSWTVQ